MARTKQTAKPYQKRLTTWTRFYLSPEQKWPTWPADYDDVHVGPLTNVAGCRNPSLGRMVDNPEQAAYIIEWVTLDDLKNFQSSPACAEFLRNLPERKDPLVSVESGHALGHLSLRDAFASPSSASSRFLTLKHIIQGVTSNVDGRVTFTAFLIPQKVDDVWGMWKEKFNSVFGTFIPRGLESVKRNHYFRFHLTAAWFWVLEEDDWVESKFGQLDQTNENSQSRTIFCQFYIWPRRLGVTPEHEEASAADPQARESWDQAIAQIMPPATAWEQERWDINNVPRFFPPEPDLDSEYPTYELEQQRGLEEYLQLHGFKVGEASQTG
ncbi:uncharacterized protein CTRU02_207977 [Colletotrichum truncatum]|uniref:Uncharacterized protein n=1 Tax=Colletotrichum truncatum TaxID=5467 RepID=A0ACC3Z2C2_COLTU|nr:uncharacterized protein CTRU02_10999 [Colletotrichum truncatum]KAF6786501.1 hypothetical protein CTRU02_10999 [Colletotrichum truncatum]